MQSRRRQLPQRRRSTKKSRASRISLTLDPGDVPRLLTGARSSELPPLPHQREKGGREGQAEHSISHSIGIASEARAMTWPESCAAKAPIAIWMKPVMPEAVPATCGRMLTAPAIDVGSSRPLPKPMMICGRKIVAISQPGNAR